MAQRDRPEVVCKDCDLTHERLRGYLHMVAWWSTIVDVKETVVVSGRVSREVRADLDRMAKNKDQSSSAIVSRAVVAIVARWKKSQERVSA